MKLSILDWIALSLLIIGGVNWGLIGAFNIDLVAAIFGDFTWLSRIVYMIVGLSAIYIAVISPRLRKEKDKV